jgi:hypothetical protein
MRRPEFDLLTRVATVPVLSSPHLGVGNGLSDVYLAAQELLQDPNASAQRREIDGNKKMLDLIETELTRIRKMAAQTDDEFLLYLIDIAIIAANAKARSLRDTLKTTDAHANARRAEFLADASA